MTTMDCHGRLADRSLLRLLSWGPSQPITIVGNPSQDTLFLRRNGCDQVTVQGHLRLPVHIRHGYRLGAGDRLLLAAIPEDDFMLAFTMQALETLIRQSLELDES